MKEFKILPRLVGTRIIGVASYSGYPTIEAVVSRIKSDKYCTIRGMYWESIQ
jgi:hypothetical protein